MFVAENSAKRLLALRPAARLGAKPQFHSADERGNRGPVHLIILSRQGLQAHQGSDAQSRKA